MALQELQIGPVSCLVDTPSVAPTAVVILVHGYAMDAEHLAPLASAMSLPATLYFPRGLLSTPLGGRSWWPLDEERRQASIAQGPRDLYDEHPDRAVARSALLAVAHQVQQQHPGLPLILAGFSQGGMLAADTLLQADLRTQALVLLSSSRIAFDEWQQRLGRLHGLPVLVAHGNHDTDLAFAAGERLRDAMEAGGADVTWVPFEGGHEIPFTVWRSIKRLVQQITRSGHKA
jgi:phospholipase/carboxylesterase